MSTYTMPSVGAKEPPGVAGPLHGELRSVARRVAMVQWLNRLVWMNLAAVGIVFLLLCVVSERWWFSAVLTYLPRAPYAAPAIVLLIGTAIYNRALMWPNVLAVALVAGPVMGFNVPLGSAPAASPGSSPLRVVSANIQEGAGSPLRLIHELDRFEPDVVVLQESARGADPFVEHYSDWHTVHLGAFFVASKFPVRVVDHCRPKAFDRWSAVLVAIEHPAGEFLLSNTHLMTPRHGASGLAVHSLLSGAGVEEFESHQQLRYDEAATTREFLAQYHDRPMLVVGDFNAPTTSSLYQEIWSEWQDAFDAAGFGYGYTSPCNTKRLWPSNCPWMRIDHILADSRWAIHACAAGQTDASDHRLVFAEVSLRGEATRPPAIRSR